MLAAKGDAETVSYPSEAYLTVMADLTTSVPAEYKFELSFRRLSEAEVQEKKKQELEADAGFDSRDGSTDKNSVIKMNGDGDEIVIEYLDVVTGTNFDRQENKE